MPSTYSARFRYTLQAPGENLNTWGTILDTVLQLVEDSIAKRVAFTLSGTKTLTSVNGAADEARCMFLDVTGGTGGTITAPSVEKIYAVRNAASGDVIVTTGAGATAAFKSGEVGFCFSDATNFRKALLTDFGGVKLTAIADPTNPQDAATKAYVDATAFASMAGTLPGQGGNAGKALTTDGSAASWQTVWRPTVLHLTVTSDATSETLHLATSADVALGGILAQTNGEVGLINAAGSNRLKTDSVGVVTAYTDAGASYPLARRTTDISAMVALDIDCSLPTALFTKSISANQVFTFSNPTASRFQGFVLKLTTSAGAVPTWPAAVEWSGGVAPTLGNGKHWLSFLWDGGASKWAGVILGVNVS